MIKGEGEEELSKLAKLAKPREELIVAQRFDVETVTRIRYQQEVDYIPERFKDFIGTPHYERITQTIPALEIKVKPGKTPIEKLILLGESPIIGDSQLLPIFQDGTNMNYS